MGLQFQTLLFPTYGPSLDRFNSDFEQRLPDQRHKVTVFIPTFEL